MILTRHFFKKLFLNETVFFEEQIMGKVIGIIAILSIVPAVVADALLFKYLLLPENGSVWAEISLFISLIMLLIGLIAVFEWDGFFLEQKDYLNLTPLPISPRTIFTAKFTSLIMFIGMFVIGINSLSSTVFVLYLAESWDYGLLSGFVLFLIHLMVMLAAGTFTVLVMALLWGVFNIILGGRLFRMLSDLIRTGLIIGQIFLIYSFVMNTRMIQLSFEKIGELRETPSAFMMNFPPLWFTGLYQVLLGNQDMFFRRLGSRALLALAIVIAAVFLVTVYSYRRHRLMLSPDRYKHVRLPLIRTVIDWIQVQLWFRNPVEKALFLFYSRVITRSRIHRARIFSYFGIGAGIMAILFASVGGYFWKDRSGSMLALPLILTFFLLIGLRDASNIPLDEEANWIFRITEGSDRWPYFLCFRKCIVLFILLPLHVLLFAFYCIFWSWQVAGLHCLYDLAFAVLLLEGLFFRRQKIPFACSYLPERSRLHIVWLIYLLAFLVYIYVPRWFEPYILDEGRRFIIFFLACCGLVTVLWQHQRLYFYITHGVIYEELPERSLAELFHAK